LTNDYEPVIYGPGVSIRDMEGGRRGQGRGKGRGKEGPD